MPIGVVVHRHFGAVRDEGVLQSQTIAAGLLEVPVFDLRKLAEQRFASGEEVRKWWLGKQSVLRELPVAGSYGKFANGKEGCCEMGA